MAEFTPITTQEQLNQVIGERIAQLEARAQARAAEKYSDYDSIKEQNGTYASQIAQLTEQVRQQTEAINGNQKTVDDLEAKVRQYETASVKTRVALELGLPYQMADRLTGNDEEAIRQDAKAMAALLGNSRPVAPLGAPEPVITDTDPEAAARAKFAKWLEDNR